MVLCNALVWEYLVPNRTKMLESLGGGLGAFTAFSQRTRTRRGRRSMGQIEEGRGDVRGCRKKKGEGGGGES